MRACPFASPSVTEHLVRGAGAAVLIGLAFWLFHMPGALRTVGAAGVLAGAVVLMRGCPTCWSIGLLATLFARRSNTAADLSANAAMATPGGAERR